MTNKRSIMINAFMSAVQVVVNAAALLILYRYLLETIGEELAGVWALVLSWTSASSIASLGLAGGAVKFVSQYLARKDDERVLDVVQTSILSVGLFLALILPLLYPLFGVLIRELVEPADRIPDALSVLPYAMGSFWLTSVAAVIQSSIDGTQRVYLRNMLVMSSSVVYLVLTIVLVPHFGLIGLARAQVLQSTLLVIAGWIVLMRLLPKLPILPYRWNRSVFKEMFTYGLNFQVISFWTLFFEPVTKSLFSKFGGVGAVFFFEMAHKMVLQLRSLIVTAHQSIVPAIAHLKETNAELVEAIYKKSFRLLLFLVIPSLPLLIALTPAVSRLWIGTYEPIFVISGVLLFIGWFYNILTNPAYFAYLGIGRLRWNVINHATVGILNAILGILLGSVYGGTGVVVGSVLALMTGSSITMLAYHKEHDIHFPQLLEKRDVFLGLAGLAGLLIVVYLYQLTRSSWSPLTTAILQIVVYVAVVAAPLWAHPVRAESFAWLVNSFFGKKEISRPTPS